ncbi:MULTISPECIES: site-specific integrase [Brachybacterium]|uniref:site-specific integrase n=1 Tax=Brachybacterium TaxID=43668 RepID=UPI0006B5FE9A|nr:MULTISPECIES: site-specific integrase [Brachybacterium]
MFLAPPKTDSSVRTIYITPETAALLRRRRTEDESQGGHERPNTVGTVFPSTAGKLWEIRGATRKMRAVFDHEDVNVPWATTHTLRHTMITDSSKAGVPLSEISQKAGHRRAATTLGYFDTKTPSTTVGARLEEHRKASRSSKFSEAK